MKNNFGKTTALIMGLLMILSGQALAFSSNNQELRRTEALAESKILIAQNGELSQEDFDAISQLAVEAQTAIGDLLAKLNSVSEADLPGKNALGQVVVDLESTIGDLALLSENEALTAGDGTAIAQTIGKLLTTVGDICAMLGTTAQSEEGRAVIECCVQGSSSLEDIALEIRSIAEAGL